MSAETPIIEVRDLVVEYGKPPKANRAVNGIGFEVRRGECVGFIGANGAGKSTTIKCLMGFVFPLSGSVKVFGYDAGHPKSREQIGYLPEVALYYPFMKARELLELYGGLSGLDKKTLRARIPGLLDRVGLGGKAESLLRSFSKGMQQRLGIAQALIHEPQALILDELSSGLDPVGRHDLRDVLLELRKKGCTIFFSSHELTEVETLCDRVIMIHKGSIVTQSSVADLMKPLNEYEAIVEGPAGNAAQFDGGRIEADGNNTRITTNSVDAYARLMTFLSTSGRKVLRTSSKSNTLEDYFIKLVHSSDGGGAKP